MNNGEKAMFAIGTKVIDAAGYIGRIVRVTEFKGSRWYDVRFPRGEAVRYESDLRLV